MTTGPHSLNELKIHRPSTDGRRSRAPLIVVAFLLLAAGGAAWWFFQRPRALPVRTAVVQQSSSGGGSTLLNASGYVTARRAATVSSKVTGRVVEVFIEEGMRVTEGQMLARIDATNVETNLRLAEAQLEASKKAIGETQAALDQAQRTLRRTTQLSESRVTSDAELDTARAEFATLEARLERQKAEVGVAERSVEVWKQQLDDTIVRAPFAGVVTAKNAQPGEMISPMSAGGSFTRTGICTIVDMASLEVEVDVNESYINRVAAGQPVVVTLDSYPDWHIPSKVIAIIPSADRQKATVRVRVGFDALDPRILPDMGLKVAFQSAEGAAAQKRSFVIPKTALRKLDGRDAVWVVRDGRVERRAIAVEGTQGDETTVTGGLEVGEKVILEGPENLGEGARVIEKQP
ncbi:efflux RND transporter periplasmic adaptor subunit [Opitutaceae bacterium EW11]|nr:efflux RND transporter periplasmic adaptor subunit [Opitutaceae bacterium EW11]